jgi:hypothetical protein
LLPKRNRCTIGRKIPPKFDIFALRNIRTAIVLIANTHAQLSKTRTGHAHNQRTFFEVETRSVMQINMAEDTYKTRISSCFMHFDGVTEQLCKVPLQRLKEFLECGSKWAKLKCQQAEIAKKSYENIDDGSVNSFMENNLDTINLEWNHHMKCWKRFVVLTRQGMVILIGITLAQCAQHFQVWF